MIVRAEHPGDRLGGRELWSPSARVGSWVSQGVCRLPQENTASAWASGAPQPKQLAALRREYKRKAKRGESLAEIEQARKWHKVDYRATIIAATRGDAKAMTRFLKLKLDGEGAEVHSQNIQQLMAGLGDAAFAASLGKQEAATINSSLGELDWVDQVTEPDDPTHYKNAYPQTYALGPHEEE